MTKLNLNIIMSLSIKVSLLIMLATQASGERLESNMHVSNKTFIVFDPNVSILDAQNCFRHSVTEQIPLVAQVATKFRRIFIQLSDYDLKKDLKTSLFHSAQAVAEYNKLIGSSSGKTNEVWLEYRALEPDHSYEDTDPLQTMDILQSIAKESNDIFEGTVTTLLFPYKLFLNHINNFLSDVDKFNSHFRSGLHWGLLLETGAISNFNPGVLVSKLKPNVIIASLNPYTDPTKLISDINLNTKEIQRTVGLDKLNHFGFFISTADTDLAGHSNMTKLVTTWQQANTWSRETNHVVVLSKAFDTPYADLVQGKTGGWWRLLENPNYNSSVDYKFQGKITIARDDDERNGANFKQLRENTTFSKEHVQVVFSLFNLTKAKNLQKFPEEQLNSLLENLLSIFNKLVILLHDDSEQGTRMLLYELQSLDLIRDRVELTVIFSPKIFLHNVFKWDVSLKEVEKSVPVFYPVLSSVKAYVVPFYENGSYGEHLKNTYLNGVDQSTYKFGYLFDMAVCSSFLEVGKEQHLHEVGGIVRKYNTQLLVFSFEENVQTVKLGAERMFRQREVLMGQCRELVKKWDSTPSSLKLSFMMMHYPKSTEFYQSRFEMTTFIEYWKKLSDWAVESNTSVVLNSMMDAERFFKEKGKYSTELGWWRLMDGNDKNAGSTSAGKDNLWISKMDEAVLKFSETENTDSQIFTLDAVQLVLIVISSTTAISLIAIGVLYLIRRNRPDVIVAKEEINNFYNGTRISQSDHGTLEAVYKLPYEKSLYEVPKNAFTIDAEGALGSGEFGMVCLGRILKNDELIKVAIKMVNPVNIHKTTVKSFLSEIKVLAHIGKHEHIAQLIGANTHDLKFGKVIIFLELCDLGSLEKHLRRTKSSLENQNAENKVSALDHRTDRYLRKISEEKMSLDFSLCEDLLRWSQEICRAMSFLASKYVVHADLATRNVLLNANKEVKICDFGLSRRMYNYTNYVKQQQEPLPWKWMAPESLRRSEFSEKSDVWAYGMTIWEIFSLGDQPYPGLGWTLQFVDMLDAGFRMDEPKYDNFNMYWLMKECWSTNPLNRPTFADLLALMD